MATECLETWPSFDGDSTVADDYADHDERTLTCGWHFHLCQIHFDMAPGSDDMPCRCYCGITVIPVVESRPLPVRFSLTAE